MLLRELPLTTDPPRTCLILSCTHLLYSHGVRGRAICERVHMTEPMPMAAPAILLTSQHGQRRCAAIISDSDWEVCAGAFRRGVE